MYEYDPRPVLLYAGACPKCRFLSALLVWLSLGSLRRVPLDRPDAEQFYDRDHREARGRPAIVEDRRIIYGWRLILALPRLIARSWWERFLACLAW
jgi:hypothetical protein